MDEQRVLVEGEGAATWGADAAGEVSAELGPYEIFVMHDTLYRSRFLTHGADAKHDWHIVGHTGIWYRDANGKVTHGTCAASQEWGDAAGCLSFGPYEKLSSGTYRADFEMYGIPMGDHAPGTVLAHIDICLDAGKNVIAHRALTVQDFHKHTLDTFSLRVQGTGGFHLLEARLHYAGIGAVGYKSIRLIRE